MDFPVEATVHLNVFPNKTQAREILRSHGFVLTDLRRDQVRVKGSFLKLKAAKALLEPLLDSQTKADITPSSSSWAPKVSSGAVPKHYNSSDGNRSRSGSRNKPLHAFPSSPTTSSSWESRSSNKHPTSAEYSTSFSPRSEQRHSFRAGKESFVIDSDVFAYAERLRKQKIDDILESHNVRMELSPVGDSCNITLHGKNARIAVSKLQSLLIDLNKSLRTQEVSLSDMNRDGKALLERIQKNRNIYNLVLLCPKNDKLHLIGPSRESHELKQRLLGRPVDPSGRTGRTLDRNPKIRSSSLPPNGRMNTERYSSTLPSSAGAAGYSPSKYQDVKEESTGPKWGAGAFKGLLNRRSHSEFRRKSPSERTNGNVHDVHDVENKLPPNPKAPKKGLTQLLKFNTEDIRKKVKSLKMRK